jgi:TusA-related sulfurtransferase
LSEEEKVKPDRFLDCVGLYCPMPIFNTTQEMENLKPGEVLEMVTGDPASVQDIPRWAKALPKNNIANFIM